MFDIESKNPDEITITTKKTAVTFNVSQGMIDASLKVGKIQGPGEFEIGDVSIRALGVGAQSANKEQVEDGGAEVSPVVAFDAGEARTIYDVEIGGVHVGIIGGCEEGLDELGMVGILCTSSVRAVRELEPKLVVAMGNVDGMVTDLKLSARTEKKLKIKNADSLPLALEVVVLN